MKTFELCDLKQQEKFLREERRAVEMLYGREVNWRFEQFSDCIETIQIVIKYLDAFNSMEDVLMKGEKKNGNIV